MCPGLRAFGQQAAHSPQQVRADRRAAALHLALGEVDARLQRAGRFARARRRASGGGHAGAGHTGFEAADPGRGRAGQFAEATDHVTGAVQRQPGHAPAGGHLVADAASGPGADAGDVRGGQHRPGQGHDLLQRLHLRARDDRTVALGHRRQRRLPAARGQRQVAQQLRGIALGHGIDQGVHRGVRMRRHLGFQLLLEHGAAFGQRAQQLAGLLQHPAQLRAAQRVQRGQVALHAVAEHVTLHLVGGDPRVDVVDLHARVLAREPARGLRVQAGGVDGGRRQPGHRRGGRSHAGAEAVAGEFEVELLVLQRPRQPHRPVVVIGLQSDRLRQVVGQKILACGRAQAVGGQHCARGALEHHHRLVAGAQHRRVGEVYLGAETGISRLQQIAQLFVSQIELRRIFTQLLEVVAGPRPARRRLADAPGRGIDVLAQT